ncbi:hypothetical protein FACS1894122_01020 [Alphaproteobacteria bacterium]|nr:hypothetical protein FACS1894122_01020 [Alphaproteobacteria bacterium]
MKKLIRSAYVMTLVSFIPFDADASVPLIFVPPAPPSTPTPEESQARLEHTQQEKRLQLKKEELEVQQKLQQVQKKLQQALREQSTSRTLFQQQTLSQLPPTFVLPTLTEETLRDVQHRREAQLRQVQQQIQQMQQEQSTSEILPPQQTSSQSPITFVPPQAKALQQMQQTRSSLPKFVPPAPPSTPTPEESQARLKHTQREQPQKLQQGAPLIFVPPTWGKAPQQMQQTSDTQAPLTRTSPVLAMQQREDSEQQSIASGTTDASSQATAETEWCMPPFDCSDMPVYSREFLERADSEWLDPTDEIKRKALMEPTDDNIYKLIEIIENPQTQFQNFIDSRWRILEILADDGNKRARDYLYEKGHWKGNRSNSPIALCRDANEYSIQRKAENDEMDKKLLRYLYAMYMNSSASWELKKDSYNPIIDGDGLSLSSKKLHVSFPIAHELLGAASNDYPWTQIRDTRTAGSGHLGWKIHISARPSTAQKIAELVIPICNKEMVGYKVMGIPCMRRCYFESRFIPGSTVNQLFSQGMGKFIVIYPKTDEQANRIAVAIDAMFQAEHLSREDFVQVFGDFSVGKTGGIYTRLTHYGDDTRDKRGYPYVSHEILAEHATRSCSKDDNLCTNSYIHPAPNGHEKFKDKEPAILNEQMKQTEMELLEIEKALRTNALTLEREYELQDIIAAQPKKYSVLGMLIDESAESKELNKWKTLKCSRESTFIKLEELKEFIAWTKLNEAKEQEPRSYQPFISSCFSIPDVKNAACVKERNENELKKIEGRLKELAEKKKEWILTNECLAEKKVRLDALKARHYTFSSFGSRAPFAFFGNSSANVKPNDGKLTKEELAELKELEKLKELNEWIELNSLENLKNLLLRDLDKLAKWVKNEAKVNEFKALKEYCTKSYKSPFHELGLYLNGRRVDRNDGGSGESDRPIWEIMNKELKYNYNFELILKNPL